MGSLSISLSLSFPLSLTSLPSQSPVHTRRLYPFLSFARISPPHPAVSSAISLLLRCHGRRSIPRDYGSLVTTYNVLTLLLELLITVITGA